MDVSELKAHIKNKTVPQFVIFTGNEWMVQKLYIKQIAKVYGYNYKYVDEMKDIYGKLKSSFIATPTVYVLRDDKDVLTDEKLQTQLLGNLLKDNILIYLWTNPDKRVKAYKVLSKYIVDFEPMKPEILKKYIKREVDLSDVNCERLMEICEYDYGRCLLEIDKIRRYVDGIYV